jgi:hypothetical protein
MSEQNNQPPETPEGMLKVENLDHFVAMLTDWHSRQVATLKHLHEVPEGIEVVIGDGEDTKKHILEGDFRDGFRLGLDLALNYMGTLPFVAEFSDKPDAPANEVTH